MKKRFRLIEWLAVIALVLLSAQAVAKNADLSRWLKNLSESAMESEPGIYDSTPEVAVSGDTVHVLWVTGDFSIQRIYYRRSLDRGKTWQPKVLIRERPYDEIDTANTYRRLAVDGRNVHIFVDGKTSGLPWNGYLSHFRSRDNGATFDAEKTLATGEYHKIYPVYAHAAGGKVRIGYVDYFSVDGKLKDSVNLLTSDDNGDTFSTHQVAFFDGENGDCEPTLYDMQADGEKIYLVYGDQCYMYGLRQARLFFARSLDGGSTFSVQRIDLPSDEDGKPKAMANQDEHYVPKIAFAGSKVYTVFNATGTDGNLSVYLRRSEDNGTSFGPAVKLSAELADKEIQGGLETLAARGKKLYVLIQTTDGRLYLKRSLDGGRSFKPIQELTVTDNTCTFVKTTWWPVIKVDPSDKTGSKVYVAGNGLFFVSSKNAGARFTGPVRLDPYAHSDLHRLQIAVGDKGEVHFVAQGHITMYAGGLADSDIFYRVFDPNVPVRKTRGNKALLLTHKANEGDDTGLERWDMMEIASNPALEFKKAMTVEAWIKVERVEDGSASFLAKTDTGKDGACVVYSLGQAWNGQIDARIATTEGGYVIVAGDPIPNGRWTHVAMTYNVQGGESNFRVYVNGELVGSRTVSGTLLHGRSTLLIGGSTAPYPSVVYNNLTIDELRFWNRALSREEIRRKMKIGLSGKEAGLVAYYNFNEPFSRYGTVRDITGRGNKGILLYKEQLSRGRDFVLKVVSPNGREKLAAGRAYKIEWQAPLKATSFTLFYSKDNKATWKSIAKVGNVREYRWRVPAQNGRKTKCFVKVIARDASGKKIGQDLSNRPFTIEVLKLLSPNGGETLKAGERTVVRWRTYALTRPVAKVLLQYSINGGKRWKTFKTFTGKNAGRFRWSVPNVSSTRCKVRVVLKDSSGKNIALDASDKVFTIE